MKDRGLLLAGQETTFNAVLLNRLSDEVLNGQKQLEVRVSYSFTGPPNKTLYEGFESARYDHLSGRFLQSPAASNLSGLQKTACYQVILRLPIVHVRWQTSILTFSLVETSSL